MSKLRPFGYGALGHDDGYDLDHVIGWLEALVDEERENVTSKSGKKVKRLEKADQALQLLSEIADI